MKKKVLENNNEQDLMFYLFEEMGKCRSMVNVFSIVSILFLIIDIILCIVSFPYLKTFFNISILFSLFSIILYIVYDYKLESIQKYIIYIENKNILNLKNIKKCLNEKEFIKLNKEIEKYSSLKEEKKLINKISLDMIIKLKDCLEIDN